MSNISISVVQIIFKPKCNLSVCYENIVGITKMLSLTV